VAQAVLAKSGKIEIWGDGEQTRSFMYIDDCLRGSKMIMDAPSGVPINLGSAELVTINQMVDIVESIAGVSLHREYRLDAPQGVRGRSSDNTLIKKRFGWEPTITLRDGLEQTYSWVFDQVASTTPAVAAI